MNRSTWLKVHRTIGIIIVIQLIASFASALVFAVRTSLYHSNPTSASPQAAPTPPAFDLQEAITKSALAGPVSAKLWYAGSYPIYEVADPDGLLAVLDGLSGRRINPADNAEIRHIMALTLNGSEDHIPSPERIVAHNVTHLQGELPVWCFRTSDGTHYYVSMKSGRVLTSADRMARLSHYAYQYLHTMKYTDNDMINSMIPIPYILAGLSLAILGVYLFFSRKMKV